MYTVVHCGLRYTEDERLLLYWSKKVHTSDYLVIVI